MCVRVQNKTTAKFKIYIQSANLMSRLLVWIIINLLFEVLISNSTKTSKIVLYKRAYKTTRHKRITYKNSQFKQKKVNYSKKYQNYRISV